MENFTFYNPVKIVFGKDTIQDIGKEIKRDKYKKVLILAGGGSIKKNGVYEAAIASLDDYEIEYRELWGVRPNPSLSHAREAIELIKSESIEAILAIGGGSVIDEAKAVAAGVYLKDLWNAFEGREIIKKALPIYTILTISGTCSEMDPFAVLTNDEDKKKWPIGAPVLFPKASIIDPQVQASLPWRQTVNGGIDALSHIMEFHFLGVNEEVVISGNEALQNALIKSLNSLQNNRNDYDARANLAWAATLALNGISGVAMKGGDWAVHNIEHSLSAFNPKIAHGAGLAVLFPAWIEYMQNENPAQFKRWAKNVWGAESIQQALINMKSQYKKWGAPVTLAELGFSENDHRALADNALKKGSLGVLKKLKSEDIINILQLAH